MGFTLGPIIGENNGNSVVILGECSVVKSCKLFQKADVIKEITIELEEDNSFRVIINNLEPYTFYNIEWQFVDEEESYSHKFRTMDITGPKRIIFVACDLPALNAGHNLWQQVNNMDKDLVIRTGDNVYMDGGHKKAARFHKRNEEQLAIEAIRQIYRDTWFNQSFNRDVLATSSNMMIGDDHEVTNGYPKLLIGHQLTAEQTALKEYGTWQEGCLLQKEESPLGYGYHRLWDDTLLIVISIFTYPNSVDFMTNCWPFIKSLINETKAHKVIITHSRMLLPSVGFLTKITGTPYHNTQQLKIIYNDLFDWLDNGPQRHVSLVFGDSHIGGKGEIIRNIDEHGKTIPFIMSTPITNWPILPERVQRRILYNSHKSVKGYNIQYAKLTLKRNFALMEISDDNVQSSAITTTLICGSGAKPPLLSIIRGVSQLIGHL